MVAAHTPRTSLGIRFDARSSPGYSADIILIKSKALVSLESNVKEMVVALGFRHKNKPVELRALGNAIDTTRRRATFRFAVRWAKAPSATLIDDMRVGMSPLRPTTQAYASDVDFIDIRLELVSNPVLQPAGVAE
ncbi:hypothetical protein P3T23_008051 [Paraburkholderia sp. GAS448]|uniref:hypothetical protein n=1 Tax=Paraburkholderia sp. GAS448 TaxID=3035136 RepID=UPI003D2329F4